MALGLILLSGCSFHYDVTLQNGDVIQARRKPRLDADGNYAFQDLSGRSIVLSPMRIREIAPASHKEKSKNSFFNP